MNKYRIVLHEKKGFYKYYKVQRSFLFFFWLNDSRAYDYIEQAKQYINDSAVVETRTVVK